MKRLNLFIIRSFIGPFIISFSIAMFFLIMQFLWKYVDDLMGKGLEIHVLLEMLFYVSASLIPLALPLAVLFSSIMTYGNLAEHNELTAFKSTGLSLFKVMRPMLMFVIVLCLSAFYFTNYILPIANLKWRAIYWDILEKKPAFNLKEGIFYKDLDDYHIKVDKKNDADGTLTGILIYDLTNSMQRRTIRAREGVMLKGISSGSDNGEYLFLLLKKGIIYEEISDRKFEKVTVDFQKSFFEEAVIKFSMDGFKMEKSNEELFKQEFEMMNFIQLDQSLDSLVRLTDSMEVSFGNRVKNSLLIMNTSPPSPLPGDSLAVDTLRPARQPGIVHLDSLHGSDRSATLVSAQDDLRDIKEMIYQESIHTSNRMSSEDDYRSAWHKKFTLPYAILVLFFIGAPLGAIVRKGGLGAPLVFATLFFLLYYILLMVGENMVESEVVEPWKGLWLSAFILTPLGIFLTYKAVNDSAIFDRDVYKRWFDRTFPRLRRKSTYHHEDSSALQ